MYTKIVVLKIIPDELNGGAKTVTIGLFNEEGILQFEVPQMDGKLFPKDIIKNREIVFAKPAKISEIK